MDFAYSFRMFRNLITNDENIYTQDDGPTAAAKNKPKDISTAIQEAEAEKIDLFRTEAAASRSHNKDLLQWDKDKEKGRKQEQHKDWERAVILEGLKARQDYG